MTHLKRSWCWERLKAGGEGTTEDEMVGWHHQVYGHEFEQALGDGDGQGNLTCCNPRGCRVGRDWTELNLQNSKNDPVYIARALPKTKHTVLIKNTLWFITTWTWRQRRKWQPIILHILQYSCLENPVDRGARWAAVYGVTQSQTWVNWLSSSNSSRTWRRDKKINPGVK